MKRSVQTGSLLMIAAMMFTTLAGCNKVTPEETKTPEPVVTDESMEDFLDDIDVIDDYQETSSTALFPDDTKILGIDVSRLTAENAYLKVTNYLNKYQLKVTVNEKSKKYTAEDFALTLSVTSFDGILQKMSEDPEIISKLEPELVVFDQDAVLTVAEKFPGITSTAKNAYIKYDKSARKYVAMPEENGYGIDVQQIIDAMSNAIRQYKDTVELTIEPSDVTPVITQDCDKMKNAVAKANSLLALNITYVFNPTTGSKHTDKLSAGDIASLLYVKKDGLTVAVDSDSLDRFVSKKASQRGVFGKSVGFTATDGSTINMNAVATGELVDTNDLYDDLNKRLSRGISGTHNVIYYVVRPGDVSGNYNGNYVEVNLTQQHAWCYKNGALVVSTDVVTGNVRAGHRTPAGVFQIRGKARNTYLVGPTWRNFVSYWMPFNGGIGLHDADRWRRKYGGTIYLRNGSHGCVNMPLSAAKKTFENVSRGTHVIVYGGSGSASPQKITGTSVYNVSVGDKPFYLDAKPMYTATLSFKSSNTKVVKVNSVGQVTIVGKGKAKITVKCKDDNTKFTVTINVFAKGEAPSTTSPPTAASPTTKAPSKPTAEATAKPTKEADPTAKPTAEATAKPTAEPTAKPTADPTASPPTTPPENTDE